MGVILVGVKSWRDPGRRDFDRRENVVCGILNPRENIWYPKLLHEKLHGAQFFAHFQNFVSMISAFHDSY
jgi:hypothetical protein